MTHKELVEIAYRWMLKNCSVGVAVKEIASGSTDEVPDVIGFGAWGHSVLAEVKVSRSDFLCDKKKSFRLNPQLGMGAQRFYVCPAGLIKVEELPAGWGLVYVDDKKRAKKVFCPYKGNIGERHDGWAIDQRNIRGEMGVLYSISRRLAIKGMLKHIYDKKYEKLRANDIINLNIHSDEQSTTPDNS